MIAFPRASAQCDRLSHPRPNDAHIENRQRRLRLAATLAITWAGVASVQGAGPSMPLNPSVTLMPGGQVLFAWADDSTDETDFLVRRSDTAAGTSTDFTIPANVAEFLDITAVIGRNYCYHVQARNAAGVSDFTSARCTVVSVPVIPANPNLALTPGGGVLVTWVDASTNEASFRIRREQTDIQETVDFIVAANATQHLDVTVEFGKNYCYSVQGFNGMGASEFTSSRCLLVGLPAMPLNPTVALRPGTQVLFTWEDASVNETDFLVRRLDTATQAIVEVSRPAESTQYIDTTVQAGRYYCYRVQARNPIGSSEFTSLHECITVSSPAIPANLAANLTPEGGVLITWEDPLTNATSFLIRRVEGGQSTDFTSSQTQYLDTTVVPAKNYCYYVQAINPMGVSSFTSPKCILVGIPAIPSNSNVALQSGGSVQFTWVDSSTNETGFRVRREDTTAGATQDIELPANATQYLDTTAESDRNYCYSVQAFNQMGGSSFTPPKCILVGVPAMPLNINVALRPGSQVLVTWADASTNETGFGIRRTDTASGAVAEFTVGANATQFIDATSQTGRNYCYSVQARNVMGASEFTSPVRCITVSSPATPTNVRLTLTTEGWILVRWEDPLGNAASFRIRRFCSTTSETIDFNDLPGGVTEYLDTTVEVGKRYCYYVQAFNPMGSTNFSSAPCILVGVPAMPSSPNTTLQSGCQVLFTWADTSSNETGLRVRREDTTEGTMQDIELPANTTQYLDTTAKADKNYCYSVQTYNEMGPSAFTSPQCVTCSLPTTPLNPNVIQRPGPQVLLTWDDVANETSYLVRRQDINTKTIVTVSRPANSTQYLDMTVQSGRSYAYWVRSRNAVGDSRFSERRTITAGSPATPVNLTAAVTPQGAVLVKWTDPLGNATSFQVWRGESGQNSYFTTYETEFLDTTVVSGKNYCYQIQAINPIGLSNFSSPAACVQTGPPAAPSNAIAALMAGVRVLFVWVDNSSNETGFRVRRECTRTREIKLIDIAVAPPHGRPASVYAGRYCHYVDTTVEFGEDYGYSVEALNDAGSSGLTSAVPASILVAPPAAPVNPKLELEPDAQLLFTWEDASSNETGFLVRREEIGNGEVKNITLPANTTRYHDTTVQYGKCYCYSVRACNPIGESEFTSPRLCRCVCSPDTPSSPAAARAPGGYVLFTWQETPPCEETGFVIVRADVHSHETERFDIAADETQFRDETVDCGRSYCYNIQALNELGVSNFTPYACIEVTPPEAPSNPSVALTPDGHVRLAWGDASSDETNFRIRRVCIDSEETVDFVVDADLTEYLDETVELNKRYCYSVEAFNFVCESGFTSAPGILVGPPAMPLNPRVALTVLGKAVMFKWKDDSMNETEFEVRREEIGSGAIVSVSLPPNTARYTDTTVEAGKNYCYSVRSRNPMGASDFTPPVCITVALEDPGVVAGAYYVAPNGSTGNDGSRGSPWPSVEYALSRVGGGKTIVLRPGQYPGTIEIGSQFSGTPESPTIIKSEFKWQAIISGGTYVSSDNLGAGVLLANGAPPNRTRWVVLDGLQVCHNEGDGIMVQGDHNTVRNCWVHHNGDTSLDDLLGRSGIGSYGFADNTIEFCLIEWNGRSWKEALTDHGVYVSGTRYVIRNNLVRYNRAYGITVGSSLQMIGANDTQVYGNLCYSQSLAGGILVKYGPGGHHVGETELDPTLPPNRLYHNTCWGNAHDGIRVYGELSDEPTLVMNNLCVANLGYSVSIGADPRRPPINFNAVFDYNFLGCIPCIPPRGNWYTDRPEAWGSHNEISCEEVTSSLNPLPCTPGWTFADAEFGLITEFTLARGTGVARYLTPTDLFGRPRADRPPDPVDPDAPVDAGAVPFEGNDTAPLEMYMYEP